MTEIFSESFCYCLNRCFKEHFFLSADKYSYGAKVSWIQKWTWLENWHCWEKWLLGYAVRTPCSGTVSWLLWMSSTLCKSRKLQKVFRNK